MPVKTNIENLFNELKVYKEQLKEINELEDQLNQERFLVSRELANSLQKIENILIKYDKLLRTE
jgi:hypothetical protein